MIQLHNHNDKLDPLDKIWKMGLWPSKSRWTLIFCPFCEVWTGEPVRPHPGFHAQHLQVLCLWWWENLTVLVTDSLGQRQSKHEKILLEISCRLNLPSCSGCFEKGVITLHMYMQNIHRGSKLGQALLYRILKCEPGSAVTWEHLEFIKHMPCTLAKIQNGQDLSVAQKGSRHMTSGGLKCLSL